MEQTFPPLIEKYVQYYRIIIADFAKKARAIVCAISLEANMVSVNYRWNERDRKFE